MESDRNYYLETIARLEPEIAMIDRDAALSSIAISLKRIADKLESLDFNFADLLRAVYNISRK